MRNFIWTLTLLLGSAAFATSQSDELTRKALVECSAFADQQVHSHMTGLMKTTDHFMHMNAQLFPAYLKYKQHCILNLADQLDAKNRALEISNFNLFDQLSKNAKLTFAQQEGAAILSGLCGVSHFRKERIEAASSALDKGVKFDGTDDGFMFYSQPTTLEEILGAGYEDLENNLTRCKP